jgi:hypothetical protein
LKLKLGLQRSAPKIKIFQTVVKWSVTAWWLCGQDTRKSIGKVEETLNCKLNEIFNRFSGAPGTVRATKKTKLARHNKRGIQEESIVQACLQIATQAPFAACYSP